MRKILAILTAAMAALFGVGTASAALSTEVATGLTALQTDALALIDLVWPVVVAITIGFVVLKLFKRGVSKV